MKSKLIAYWIATVLFCLAMAAGGISDLLRTQEVVDVLRRLGYPNYLAIILGVAKLLGVIALIAPGLGKLKEWAYAGFTFDLLGALASHGFSRDPAKEFFPAVAMLALGAASYFLRPPSRRMSNAPVPFNP